MIMKITTYKCDICGTEQKAPMKSSINLFGDERVNHEDICGDCSSKMFEALEDIKNPPRFLTLDEHEGKHIGVVRIPQEEGGILSLRNTLVKHYKQTVFIDAAADSKDLSEGKRIKIKLKESDYSVLINIKETKLY